MLLFFSPLSSSDLKLQHRRLPVCTFKAGVCFPLSYCCQEPRVLEFRYSRPLDNTLDVSGIAILIQPFLNGPYHLLFMALCVIWLVAATMHCSNDFCTLHIKGKRKHFAWGGHYGSSYLMFDISWQWSVKVSLQQTTSGEFAHIMCKLTDQ